MDTYTNDDLAEMIIKLQTNMQGSIKKIETEISVLEKSIDNINTHINMINHKLSSEHIHSGPTSFLDALSPSAITGAPTRHINPAYQE